MRFSNLQTAFRQNSIEEPTQVKMRYRASKTKKKKILVNVYELLLAQSPLY